MMRSADSLIIFVARVALAVLFLWGGAMKLMGYAGFIGYLQTRGVPYPQLAATARRCRSPPGRTRRRLATSNA